VDDGVERGRPLGRDGKLLGDDHGDPKVGEGCREFVDVEAEGHGVSRTRIRQACVVNPNSAVKP
jgi:hypothetical protein